MSESEHRMIEILRILNVQEKPIGSKVIADELKNKGYNLGERAVRYHMQILDEKGYTERKGYSGRVITELGRGKLEKGLIYDQVDFTFSKFEERIYLTDFDYNKKCGNVIVNTSNILDNKAFDIIKKVFAAGVCVSPLINAKKTEINGKKGYVMKTICGTTIDGVFLKNGIPSIPQYGGLVEIEDYYPTKFSELISYKKTSITPLDAFIAKDMTSVLDVAEHGTGTIPANFRIIPETGLKKAKEIIQKLEKVGIGGVLEIGETSENVLGIPVPEGMVGISIIGGITPFCAAQEMDYKVDIKTGESSKHKIKKAKKVEYKKTPFILTKSLNRMNQVDYDIETNEGNIVANISYLDRLDLDDALTIMKRTYKNLPKYMNPLFNIVDHPSDESKVGIATVCSLSIDGILINNGIMSTPRYGGLLELGKPPLFVEMISYDGSSIDPHKIFIFKNLTQISKRKNPKKILASIKEVPYIARPECEAILDKINENGFPIFKVGKPRELVYNAKVDNYNFGIVTGSGLNSIAAIKEKGIAIEAKAVETILPIEDMSLIYEQ
ncbi:DUF128 domain-containing protein [uncultured Methanobrevibacter sp.]|uniref:DUF128 domain-containing protein n=1 Tax=uncultured Methanobrevibacter sp. TaxID=253161 RepID=UPI0025FE5AC9|nr:DUF128 domain-containing protein [uncultured Methanobrevibacter sp.]